MNPVYFEDRTTGEFDPRVRFPARASSDAEQPCVDLPRELVDRLVRLAKAYKGFPGNSSGGYPRMLCFGIVTITTLGYGDILPISDEARMLFGLEAITGVILIGLFLNALSQEMGQNKGNENPVASG
jgi:hypothetical protein